MREEVVAKLQSIVEEVISPFRMLSDIAKPFIKAYESVFGIVKSVKEAYNGLKNGLVWNMKILALKLFYLPVIKSVNYCSTVMYFF